MRMHWFAGCGTGWQVQELERRSRAVQCKLPVEAQQIRTPLQAEAWQRMLAEHPDRELVEWMVRGIQQGFRVGFQQDPGVLKHTRQNLSSVRQHPEVVQEYLDKEQKMGRVFVVGKPEQAEVLGVHCSPFGVIPKKGKVGRWRLIVDLSSPAGGSVNEGISAELSSLSYTSVDEVMRKVLELGKGTLLAKADIKQAYRNVPVHPMDRGLLGMQWQGKLLVDGCLPFGLRSAPLLFTVAADLLQWAVCKRGATWVRHYIDDFITVGKGGGDECMRNFLLLKQVCQEAGMPTEPDKDEGPATEIVFLGMELDSQKLEIRLPQEKLERLRQTLLGVRGMKACRKRQLLSVIGVLSHASKAVRAGRSFVRRLIDLSAGVQHMDRFVRLSREARADIEWWYQFGQEWNGTAMMWHVSRASPQVILTSDASGGWGCGAWWETKWFQLQWQGLGESATYGITAKELLPIVVAVAIWGKAWQGKVVVARCDNMAVVAIVNSGTSKEAKAMHLRRCLAFLEAKWAIQLWAEHVRGVDNEIADALSRNRLDVVFDLCPQMMQDPELVSEEILQVVVRERQAGRDPDWKNLWKISSEKELHPLQSGRTE